MDPEKIVPSTPTPANSTLVGSVARIALLLAGPALARRGVNVDDSTIEAVAGAAMTIGAGGWSIWQKYQQAKLDHAGSVASAEMRMPVKAVSP